MMKYDELSYTYYKNKPFAIYDLLIVHCYFTQQTIQK